MRAARLARRREVRARERPAHAVRRRRRGRAHAGASVDDVNADVVARQQRRCIGVDAVNLHVAGADGELAAVRHRVTRIDGKIEEDLLEFARVRPDIPEVFRRLDGKFDVLAQKSLQQRLDFIEDRVKIDDLQRHRLPSRYGPAS